jgi:hypothetical protein
LFLYIECFYNDKFHEVKIIHNMHKENRKLIQAFVRKHGGKKYVLQSKRRPDGNIITNIKSGFKWFGQM